MEAFAALSDPTRRRILEILAEGDRSVGEIVAEFSMSQPAISRHLRLLREAGLVSRRGEGPRRLYRLDPGGLVDVEAWVDQRRREWQRRLDALERHLERESERKRGTR
ncbi:MAG: metalloregulator ArsR/SmtB family transcription factor [Myxococcota bacterium]